MCHLDAPADKLSFVVWYVVSVDVDVAIYNVFCSLSPHPVANDCCVFVRQNGAV